jgi:hypothetical protein
MTIPDGTNRSRRVVPFPIAKLVVLATLALLAFFAIRIVSHGDGERAVFERAPAVTATEASERSERTAGGAPKLRAEVPTSSSRASPLVTRHAAGGPPNPTSGDAEIEVWLKFADRVPAAGIAYTIREAGVVLAEGVTGENGRGPRHSLPAGSVVARIEPIGQPVLHVRTLEPGFNAPMQVELPVGAEVRGRVVDEFGVPIAGAAIAWAAYDIDDLLHEHEPRVPQFNVIEASGEDGTFLVPYVQGNAVIEARREGFAPGEVAWIQQPRKRVGRGAGDPARHRRDATFVLERGTTSLAGRVIDATGSLVAGARVTIDPPTMATLAAAALHAGSSTLPTITTSTADGRFAFDALRSGRHAIRVVANGFAQHESDVELAREQHRELVIELIASGGIAGTVRDLQGRSRAEVRIGREARSELEKARYGSDPIELATSGEDGRFEIADLPPGTCVLVAEAERDDGGGSLRCRAAIEVASGEVTTWDPVLLGADLAIRGIVRDERGALLSEVAILALEIAPAVDDIFGADPARAEGKTDSNGAFEVAVASEHPHRLIALRAFDSDYDEVETTARPGQEIELVLPDRPPPSAVLSGTIVVDGNTPPESLRDVQFMLLRGPEIIEVAFDEATGRFVAAGLSPGVFRWTITWRSLLLAMETDLVLAPGELRDLGSIPLRESEPLTLRFAGLAVEGIGIFPARLTSLLEPVHFDGFAVEGKAQFPAPPPGRYRVTVALDRVHRDAGVIDVRPQGPHEYSLVVNSEGASLVTVDFASAPGVGLTGFTILDRSGTVMLAGIAAVRRDRRLEARFTLPPGEYRFIASPANRHRIEQRFEVGAAPLALTVDEP